MTTAKRKSIIEEANKRLKENFVLSELQDGEFEAIQDKYIEEVCKENGFTLQEFYNTNGKELNKLIK